MRIFMEGQDAGLEPCGDVLVILAKLFLAGAILALGWASIIRFARQSNPSQSLTAALVLSILTVAFWLTGKACVLLGRWMRQRGLKLP
jgi:hypothetical protein